MANYLPGTDIQVSKTCLGCWQFSGTTETPDATWGTMDQAVRQIFYFPKFNWAQYSSLFISLRIGVTILHAGSDQTVHFLSWFARVKHDRGIVYPRHKHPPLVPLSFLYSILV